MELYIYLCFYVIECICIFFSLTLACSYVSLIKIIVIIAIFIFFSCLLWWLSVFFVRLSETHVKVFTKCNIGISHSLTAKSTYFSFRMYLSISFCLIIRQFKGVSGLPNNKRDTHIAKNVMHIIVKFQITLKVCLSDVSPFTSV